jgi:hypothetical protein
VKRTFVFAFCLSCFLLASACKERPVETGSSDRISLLTDKNSYAKLDTINLCLKNNSGFDMVVGLRCGSYLEMFYQEKDDDHWSDILWFWYMSLRCLTLLDTIETNNTLRHSLPAGIFDSTGTFRLLVDVYIREGDCRETIISNYFKIE